MKYLISATTLALLANTAVAGDIYGSFNSPELDTGYGLRYRGPAAPAAPSGVRVSLYDFFADGPDLPASVTDVPPERLTGERLTSYDTIMLGNPDASPISHAAGSGALGVDRHAVAQAE